jgi:hypothetical protein
MKVYAFDIDETLEVNRGPVTLNSIVALKEEGHCVGLCGNYAVVTNYVAGWHSLFSFIGPMEMTKAAFLGQLKTYIPAEEVVMVGNIKGVSGTSDDKGAADLAGVRFIKESDFAEGSR